MTKYLVNPAQVAAGVCPAGPFDEYQLDRPPYTRYTWDGSSLQPLGASSAGTNATQVAAGSTGVVGATPGGGMVLLDGTVVTPIGHLGSFAWAARPSAAANAGRRFFATDSMLLCDFVSDGTSWLPLSHIQLMSIYESSAYTGSTNTRDVASVTIPGGLLTGRKIVAEMHVEKGGTNNTADIFIMLGGTMVASKNIPATGVALAGYRRVIHCPTVNSQIGDRSNSLGTAYEAPSGTLFLTAVDTSVPVSLVVQVRNNAAADSFRIAALTIGLVR